MKKWSVSFLFLWLVTSPMVPVLAAVSTAQSELDQATIEESQIRTRLLEIQEKRKKAKDRLEKQDSLKKDIEDLKALLNQNTVQSKEAQDTMKKTDTDFQAAEKIMLAEEQRVKPFKDALERKTTDRKTLESLILNQQTQLKKLEQEISTDTKQYARMSSNSAGIVKKMDVEKANLDKEKSRFAGLKKEGEDIQARIVLKQKELDSL